MARVAPSAEKTGFLRVVALCRMGNGTFERPHEQNSVASLAREASETFGIGFGQFQRLAKGTLERLKQMGLLWPDMAPSAERRGFLPGRSNMLWLETCGHCQNGWPPH